MSNKFLESFFEGSGGSGGIDLSSLLDGSTSLYLKSLKLNDILGNENIKSDNNKFLVSGSFQG